MSILQSVGPPGKAPGRTQVAPTTRTRSLPVPITFVGRAVSTLWSDTKARIGIVILGLS